MNLLIAILVVLSANLSCPVQQTDSAMIGGGVAWIPAVVPGEAIISGVVNFEGADAFLKSATLLFLGEGGVLGQVEVSGYGKHIPVWLDVAPPAGTTMAWWTFEDTSGEDGVVSIDLCVRVK